jgi:hypothetical protein
MGCGSITGVNPDSEQALSFATSTITQVISHANGAYSTALGLLGVIAGIVNMGDINTNINVGEPGTLPDVSQYLGSIPTPPNLGDIPNPPAISYDFNESAYTSNLGDLLNVTFYNEINNGSTGLTVIVENDIYLRESERDLQELADTKSRIASMWAETNSPLPDAVLYALQTYADIKYQNMKSDKSRDIRIESMKRADDNAKFVKDLAMKYESVIRDYMGKYWDRQIKRASDIMNYGILVYDALLKWKLALVELYKGQAQAYEAQAHAVAAIAGVQIAEYQAQVQYIIGVANIQMEGIKAQVELLKGQVQAAIAASDAIGRVASSLASGSLSAINAGIGINYTGHESKSLTGNMSNTCTETYPHEESPA